jgi:hypothetical protein
VLIGGFNNLWTTRLSQELHFRLVTLDNHENVIQDSQHPSTVWTLDVSRSALANSRDYGLVSCFFDPETEQHVILAAGIGKSGPKRQPISSPAKVGWMAGSRPFTRSQVQIWKWWSQQTSLKANMDRPTSLRTLSGRSSETTNWVTRVP